MANIHKTNDKSNFKRSQQKQLKVPGNRSEIDVITGKDDGPDCGDECRNRLHELGHPQEHSGCAKPGQVIDIWGYCR